MITILLFSLSTLFSFSAYSWFTMWFVMELMLMVLMAQVSSVTLKSLS